MNLEIFPYEGMGPIKLGMTQTEVRNAMGIEFETFMKSRSSKMPTDNFRGEGIHVYYKLPGICNAIEVASPANPTFRGYRLMGLPFNQLSEYFQREDSAVEIDDNGLTSKLFGLGLYVPDLDESPEAPVKGVIVFEKGYYG